MWSGRPALVFETQQYHRWLVTRVLHNECSRRRHHRSRGKINDPLMLGRNGKFSMTITDHCQWTRIRQQIRQQSRQICVGIPIVKNPADHEMTSVAPIIGFRGGNDDLITTPPRKFPGPNRLSHQNRPAINASRCQSSHSTNQTLVPAFGYLGTRGSVVRVPRFAPKAANSFHPRD
jgi:hypothetical protein